MGIVMAVKFVQQEFGQAVIDKIHRFAEADIPTVQQIYSQIFPHVDDHDTRQALADTMYGARWLYKLGFAVLVQDEKQFAHVRSQVIDYASVCETLLGEMIIHGVQNNLFNGQQYKFSNAHRTKRIYWNRVNDIRKKVRSLPFWWRIEVAGEEGIIEPRSVIGLNKLKNRRNTVHLSEKIRQGVKYYIGLSSSAYNVCDRVIDQTRRWKQTNP